MCKIDSDPIGCHHKKLWLFMEKLSESKIPNSLLDEGVSCNEFQALHLSKIGFLAWHVDEEEFGDIPWSHVLFIFLSNLFGTAKDSRMTAIYFWYSALSSAIVLVFLILVINSWSLLMDLEIVQNVYFYKEWMYRNKKRIIIKRWRWQKGRV